MRNELAEKISRLSSVLNVYPSEANFLLVKIKEAERFMKICLTTELLCGTGVQPLVVQIVCALRWEQKNKMIKLLEH